VIRPNVISAPRHAWDDYARLSGGLGMQIADPVHTGGGGYRPILVLPPAAPPKKTPPPKVVIIAAPPPTHKPVPRVPVVPKKAPPTPPKPAATCPSGQTLTNGKCVATVKLPPITACPDIQIDCPPPGTLVLGPAPCYTPQSCKPLICPTGQTIVNGKCAQPGTVVCPSGQYPVNGVCVPVQTTCPGGFVDADGNCVQVGSPTPVGGACPSGWELDSSGNCISVSAVTNPYSLYLPASDMPGATTSGDANPALPAATPCATGQFADLNGACWPNGLEGWLEASTIFAGYPNMEVVGGALGIGVIILLALHGKKAKR
jgi:hypothetical protein